ncbi:MAG: flagellar protein FlgN [Gammaproteobacteria bacterium]|nr:flagellar protein FlgN [Gammaproteobacteria bacterium]
MADHLPPSLSLTDGKLQQEVTALMQEEQAALDRLFAVLSREELAIARKDVDAMHGTLTEKLDLLEQLQHLDERRVAIIATAGERNSRDGFVKLLERLTNRGERPPFIEQWQRISSLLNRCHQQHRVNIQLLEIGQRQVRNVLSVLMGPQSQGAKLYTPGGATSEKLSTNTFAKA